MKKIWSYIDRYRNRQRKKRRTSQKRMQRQSYIDNGMVPWTEGYVDYKLEQIEKSLTNRNLLAGIQNGELPSGYGYRIDERIVEYPWIFSKLPSEEVSLLDAGSTLNYGYVVNHDLIENKNLTIFTFAPEEIAYYKKRISYVYGDLREMYFKDESFDFVVSQSTIEHIDMDNSVYGYDLEHNKDKTQKSYEYMKAINEMVRVLKPSGHLLLTFPFGIFEHHGFFQQFDSEMLGRIYKTLESSGKFTTSFFKYAADGWSFASLNEVEAARSHNPHTGLGVGEDMAAHSRAVACIEFIKTN